jgi:hypothetical protein
MLQLSDALAKLEPTLQRGVTVAAEKYGEEEYAKGEAEFWANREKWNALIRAGQIPEGVSPYYQRGLQRAALKQHAGDFYAQTHASFYGPEGMEARTSNDPKVMQKFLNDQREKYHGENLSKFSALDMQEVFNPAMEATFKTMQQTHASYRVAENEKEYEALTTANIESALTRNLQQIQKTDSDEVRAQWMAQAAREANDYLYNPDTGFVANSGKPHRGNEILIDTIATLISKTGDMSYGEVLKYVTNKDGAPIAKTQYAMAKIDAAEMHVIEKNMKYDHFNEWKRGLQYSHFQEMRGYEEAQRSDERWAREKENMQRTDSAYDDTKKVKTLARRIFEGLRQEDAKKGVAIIDEALEIMEIVDPEKAKEWRSTVHTITNQKSDYPDDPMTVAQLRLDMSQDPLGFNVGRLKDAVHDKLLKPSTYMQMMDDLERNQGDADHPLMKQREFKEMLEDVRRGSIRNAGDEYGAEGRLRAANATEMFRDLAVEWLEANPNKSHAAFRNYMRLQIPDVLERSNPEYGATMQGNRETQETKGKEIQRDAAIENRQRELDEQDAREAKEAPARAKAKQEQEVKQRDQREREELEGNIRRYKFSGERTSEGRKIMKDEKGNIATERTVTVTDKRINDGRPTNIPTIYNGNFFTEKEAIEIIAKNKGVDPDTGHKLKGYYSINDAVIAARERSNRLGKAYGQGEGGGGNEKLSPKNFGTLIKRDERDQILEMTKRVLNAGTTEKPASEPELKELLVKILGPYYEKNRQSPTEMSKDVDDFMRELLKSKQLKKDK